jgi:hypothetical protein
MTYFIYNDWNMIVSAYDDIGVMLFDYLEYLKAGQAYHFGYIIDLPDVFWSPMSELVQ